MQDLTLKAIAKGQYDEGFAAGRIAGLKEAAEIARHFPAAGKFEDGRFVAGPNTPYAIATAILARAGDAEKEG